MANIETIQHELAQLQTQYRAQVATLIRTLMDEHGLTVDDLAPPAKRAYTRKAVQEKASTKRVAKKKPAKPVTKKAGKKAAAGRKAPFKGPQPPKYRHPETGQTWSGFARPPKWIAEAANRDDFLIEKTAA